MSSPLHRSGDGARRADQAATVPEVADFVEQWSRVLRFRKRYADTLADAPAELMSMRLIPEERMLQIRQWIEDMPDYGLTCCLHLHHLKDWAHHDAAVPLTNRDVDRVINADPALRAVADICNGVKHAVLTAPRSDLSDPAQIARNVGLNWRDDDHGLRMLRATHDVVTDPVTGATQPLLTLIDEAVATWTALLRTHGVLPR